MEDADAIDRAHDSRVAAAAAVRDLVHALSGHDVATDVLEDLTRTVRGLTPPLERAPRRERAVPSLADIADVTREMQREGGARPHAMDDRAVAGRTNPTSVEVRDTRREGDDGVTEVVFGPAFEGALGRVHGGMVAAVFDDLGGHVLSFVGKPGFSARLEVSFHAPVPIEVPIEFRVRLREASGRKVTIEGEARLGDQVLATTEILMITVDQEHFETHAHDLLGRERTPDAIEPSGS